MAVTYHLFCFISSAILSYLISAARRGRGPGPSQFMRGKARSESGEAEAGDWVIANSKFQWSSVYWSQTQQTVHIMEQRIFWWRVKGSGVLICSPSNQIISTTCPPFSSPKVSISGWKLVLLFIFCWVFLHWHCYARKSNNRINDLDNEWDMISRNQRRAYLRWSTAAQVCPKSGKFPPEYHIIEQMMQPEWEQINGEPSGANQVCKPARRWGLELILFIILQALNITQASLNSVHFLPRLFQLPIYFVCKSIQILLVKTI